MKHLYIIGNGFDLFMGLKTSYQDFREWLKFHYIFVYEALESVYGIQNIEWWNDFEVSLGKLDIDKYVKSFAPPEKSIGEILKEIEEKRKKEQKLPNLPPSLTPESPCADRLRGLLDILHDCMRKWIQSMRSFENLKYVNLDKECSFFLNFNYTETLEWFYHISKSQILHIHGAAYNEGKLIFGHNHFLYEDRFMYDGGKVSQVLERYHKNPYEYIYKNEAFFEKVKNVEYIHVYGMSFSPVDIGYLDWICEHTPNNTKWEVSWHTDNDKKRIENFILQHRNLKNRLDYIRLDSIENKSVEMDK